MTNLWSILPRENDLSRLYDPISGWTYMQLTERHNLPDTWTVTGPSEKMDVFAPGKGSVLLRGDEQVTSGKLTNFKRSRAANPKTGAIMDMTTASFTSDLMQLGQRVVIPTPSYVMSYSTTFQFPDAYDLRTGAIESIILGYIRSHAGDLAQANRRIARLRVPASLGRGGNTQVSGRFDQLGVLIQSLAEAGNLRIRILHTEEATGLPWLDVVIDSVADLSADIRFGTADSSASGIISDWSYELGMPTTTRAIVAGGGELATRNMLHRYVTPPEVLWGVAAETLVDQRHVPPLDDPARITKTAASLAAAIQSLQRSLAHDQFLRQWVAGSTRERTAQLAWAWLVGWDRQRAADLTPQQISDIASEAAATTAEGSTIDDNLNNARDTWSTTRLLDDQIRTQLNEALVRAWEGPGSDLAHSAAIIQATNLLDQRIFGVQSAIGSIQIISLAYGSEASAHWNARVAEVTLELARGGDEALEEGAGLVKVEFTPMLGPDLEYRRDVRVGDIVGFDLPGLEPAKDKIREATTTVTVTSGEATETVSVVVGTPDAPTSRTQQQTARALRGITVIQRSS